jgi:hypothetical protein
MNESKRISTNALGVVIGLELGVFWILMGLETGFAFKPTSVLSYIVTLGAHRHTIMTVAGLILIPICAREIKGGFLAAMVLGMVTFVLASIGLSNALALLTKNHDDAASARYRLERSR